MPQTESEVTNIGRLFAEVRGGSKELADQLVDVFYNELRQLAAAKMKGERTDHSWQPTLLVNELYLELIKIKELKFTRAGAESKQAFFGLAAYLMKRLLIHHARPLASRVAKVSIDEALTGSPSSERELQNVEDLLTRLASIDPRLRTVVEMKVFEGIPVEEIALRLQCAPRTVARHWRFAKQWLGEHLAGTGGAPERTP